MVENERLTYGQKMVVKQNFGGYFQTAKFDKIFIFMFVK